MAEQAITVAPQERVGRPTLCSPAVVDKILAAVAIGSYWRPACEAAGVSYQAVREWIAKAERDRSSGITSSYTEFTDKLERAQAEAEVSLARAVAGTPDDWRAQAFILERRYRANWGKSDAPSVAVQVVVSDALASQLADAMRVAQVPAAIEVTATQSTESDDSA
jgi:hypothetical protein